MTAPNETASHDTLLRMILMIAACFAIGSIGFLLAVLLQQGAQSTAGAPQLTVVQQQQQKNTAMQSLAASEQHVASTSTSTSTSTATASAPAVSPAQADTTDTNAAAKLKVLENLNSQ